jgi:hypothetical protein
MSDKRNLVYYCSTTVAMLLLLRTADIKPGAHATRPLIRLLTLGRAILWNLLTKADLPLRVVVKIEMIMCILSVLHTI